MSRQYFKATLKYDSNYGPTLEQDIYIREDNSTDYREAVYENGEYVECRGTDSYCDALACALSLSEAKNHSYEVTLVEGGCDDWPDKVKETFNLPL